ncbi:hypothetical protein [Natronobacterium texcoconense]|uniref:DUF5518 domain-containing protein n=1 Tax=Natronobacterium texcoconense TaxID=1095778 RepID=A0A1H1A9W7_NATTX|nr:hypothetical protein [Natronobacterium texcoconense]SDQ36076.1 hypothetical protein SAMN04489842_0608 [Natronobacterium texcoconense]
MADWGDGAVTAESEAPVRYFCKGTAAIGIGCVVTVGTALVLVAADASGWIVLWSPLAGGMVTGALSPANFIGSTLSGAVGGVFVTAAMVGSFLWWAANASPPTASAGMAIIATLAVLVALGVVLVLLTTVGGLLGGVIRRAYEHEPDRTPE